MWSQAVLKLLSNFSNGVMGQIGEKAAARNKNIKWVKCVKKLKSNKIETEDLYYVGRIEMPLVYKLKVLFFKVLQLVGRCVRVRKWSNGTNRMKEWKNTCAPGKIVHWNEYVENLKRYRTSHGNIL